MANTLKIKRGTAATIPQGQLAEPLFTTDTYDLYIGKGSGGNQRIQNYIASGTSSQFLKGDGTLDSTSYQPLITAGTTLQYYRGDKTFQTLDTSVVPENGPIYFTEPRVRATVLTGLNLSGGGTIAATDSILTAFGKVQNQISALVGGATYQGTWNASTNTPTLASGTGTKGFYYVVSVAGSTNLDGITDWKIGDWAIFNGTTWDKVDNTDAVSSVNGFTGAVNLGLGNISDVTLSSPTNAQLLRFNGTSSKWENWTPTYISGNETITLSGDISGSGTTTIATTIGAGKVTNAMLAGSIAASKLVGTDIATVGTITTGIWNGTTIAIADGGTGATTKAAAFNALSPMTTLGDIIYGGASGAGTRLAGNTVASKRFLIQTGDGTNSAAPSWGSIAAGDVPTLNQNTTGSAATLTTARTLTIGATGKTFDGSANVSWSLAEIGAQAALTNPITGDGTEASGNVAYFTGNTAIAGSSSLFFDTAKGLGINVAGTVNSSLDVGITNTTALLIGNSSDTIVSGDVIGNLSFFSRDGSTNSKGTVASIRSYATATYNTGSVSGDLRFYVSDSAQPNGAIISGSEALRINPDRSIRILSYTTNGILKVSGGDGTIGIAVAADFPTLNQNTTGSAATLTTGRNFTINGTAKSFNGSADVSWTAAEIGLTSYMPLVGGQTMSGGYTISNANNTYTSPASTNVPNIYIYNSNNSSTTAHSILTLRTNTANGGNPFISFDVNGVQGYSVGIDNADSDAFKIAPNWDSFSTPAIRIASDASIRFPQQTTNGFVKFTGANGTISVDSTTYNSGGGTANYVSKYTAANTLGNSQIYDDGSKVYINTTTTNAISTSGLTAAGGSSTSFVLYNTSATAGVIGFLYGSSVAGGMAVSSTGDLRFETGNAEGTSWPERARLYRTSGNFSLGYGGNPADSGFRLDVSGTTRLAGALSGTSATFSSNVISNGIYKSNTASVGGYFDAYDGTNDVIFGSWKSIIGSGNSYDSLIYSSNASSAFYVMTGGSLSPRLTISSNGAATFSSSINSVGNITVKGTGNYSGFIADNSSSATIGGGYFSPYSFGSTRGLFGVAGAISGSTDNNLGIFAEGGTGMGAIKFFVGGSGTATHTFASNGNVLIGTTTDSGYKLRVNGTSYFDSTLTMAAGVGISFAGDTRYGVAKIYNASVGDMFGIEQVGSTQTGSGAATRMFAANSSGNFLSLGWYTNATAFTDALKIAITSGDATFVSKVTATSFFESSDIRLKSNIKDYKSSDILNISAKIYEKDGKIEVGYIAQELQDILGNAVSVRDNGYLDLSYRQVHTAKIAALEEKIKELEAKLK